MVTNTNMPDFSQLKDAYGSAVEADKILKSLLCDKNVPISTRKKNWFELWSRLYHQDSIFTASYAATLLLVSHIENVDNQNFEPDFLLLPACIELARSKSGSPRVPENFSERYKMSIMKLGLIAKKVLAKKGIDGTLKKSAEIALLVSEGKFFEADTLLADG